MTYRIALPDGGRLSNLDLIEPNSSAVQRFLRRQGLAGYEPSTVAALLASFERAEDCFGFIDVGANIGLHSLVCAAMFEPGAVVALEPTPDLVDLATRIAAANGLGIDVRPIAASDEIGYAELHLADATDVSNSLEPGFKASRRSVSVATTTIDQLVADLGILPSVIKIDVEGHEAAVLDGAREVLERHRPALVVEVLNRRGGRLADAINASLRELEYCCYELSPDPDWELHRCVIAGSGHSDWLLVPEPIDEQFISSWKSWRERTGACTPDRSSRVPVLRTAWSAFRRGGLSEVGASSARFLRR